MSAAQSLGYTKIAAAGGVCANTGIRSKLARECDKRGYTLYMPEFKYCGDNAAMIGAQGYYDFLDGKRAGANLNALATLSLEDI